MKTLIILSIIASSCITFAEEVPNDLKILRKSREAKIDELNAKYLKALERLKVKYTKKGDLTTALKIDEEIKEYQQQKSNLAIVSTQHPKIIVKKRGKIFSNRNYVFLEFPDTFSEWHMDFIDGGAKIHELYLNVKQSGIVYVVCSKDDFKDLKKDDWNLEATCKREPIKATDAPPVIISKHLDKGTHIVKTKSFIQGRLLTKTKM